MRFKHGFLFLSCRPHQLAARVEHDDVVEMFAAAVRCLTYAHIVRGVRGWETEYTCATRMRPCARITAQWRNTVQCKWTAATYANYAWMGLVADALRMRAGKAILPYAKRLVDWFLDNIPFKTPLELSLPTPFPSPASLKCVGGEAKLRESTRPSRELYKQARQASSP